MATRRSVKKKGTEEQHERLPVQGTMNPAPAAHVSPATLDGCPDMIPATVRLWEGRYDRKVSTEEARDIITAVVGFFSLLSVWDAAEDNAGTGPQ